MGPVNTPGENVDEWAVGGDGPLRRPRSDRARTDRALGSRGTGPGGIPVLRGSVRRTAIGRARGQAVLTACTAIAVAALVTVLGLGAVPAVGATADGSATQTGATAARASAAAPSDAPTDDAQTGDAQTGDASTGNASTGGGDAGAADSGGFLPGATPDPSASPTGPVFGDPTPTGPPTTTPIRPTIADPGDITTGTARFHGQGTPGHSIRVASGAATTCTVRVVRDGTWSCLGTVTSAPAQVFTATDRTDPSLRPAATPPSDVVTPPTLVTRGTTTGTVAGDGHPGATVSLSASGASAEWDAKVGPDGRWRIALPRDVRDGDLTIVATQTASTATGYRSDLRSAASAPRTITLDRSAPSAPRLLDPRSGERVRTQPVLVSGTGEPRAVVTVAVDRAPVCIATVSANGSWTCRTSGTIAPGARTLSAVQRDVAGNTSRSSSAVAIVVTPSSATPSATGSDTLGPSATGTDGTSDTVDRPSTASGSGSGAGGGAGSGAGGATDGSGSGAVTPGGLHAGAAGPDWAGPAGDWSARTAYDRAVPTMQSVSSWHTVVVATAVAAGFLLLIVAPLAVVAGVARGRFRSPFAALFGRNRPRTGSRADDALPTWVSIVSSVAIATCTTLLGTGVALEARYARLAIAVAIGSTLLTAGLVLATRWAAGRERHLVGYRVSPVLVLAALVACALTRAGDLAPALVVGVVLVPTGRAGLGTGPMCLGSDVVARLRGATWRTATLLGLAVAGWAVHSVVTRGGIGSSLVSDVAITLCVGGLGAAVVSLLPFPGSAGMALLAGPRAPYAALVVVAAALTAAVYSGAAGTHLAPVTWVVAVVVCVSAAVGATVWARAPRTATDSATS